MSLCARIGAEECLLKRNRAFRKRKKLECALTKAEVAERLQRVGALGEAGWPSAGIAAFHVVRCAHVRYGLPNLQKMSIVAVSAKPRHRSPANGHVHDTLWQSLHAVLIYPDFVSNLNSSISFGFGTFFWLCGLFPHVD